MGWSFRIGRLAGINVYVHFTFLLLLGWLAIGSYLQTGDVAIALGTLLLISTVFFIIVLHELGHAMAARYYGIPTRDITLLPIGGVARLERMPEKPAQELVVALAGPAVNVVLAAIFWMVALVHGVANPERALSWGGNIIDQLFWINVMLVVFNMLPAFPMDGGRVLRALLSMRLGPNRATAIASRVGQGMAILFFVLGLYTFSQFGNPMLLLVSLFIWVGAREEAAVMRVRSTLAGVYVADVMDRKFATVEPDDTLHSVAHYARQSGQKDFPVVVGGRLVGMLSRVDLRYGIAEFGPDARVLQRMRRDFPTLGPDESAERGLALLATGYPVIPVIYTGRVIGMLTAENISEFLWYSRTPPMDRPIGTDHDRSRTGV